MRLGGKLDNTSNNARIDKGNFIDAYVIKGAQRESR